MQPCWLSLKLWTRNEFSCSSYHVHDSNTEQTVWVAMEMPSMRPTCSLRVCAAVTRVRCVLLFKSVASFRASDPGSYGFKMTVSWKTDRWLVVLKLATSWSSTWVPKCFWATVSAGKVANLVIFMLARSLLSDSFEFKPVGKAGLLTGEKKGLLLLITGLDIFSSNRSAEQHTVVLFKSVWWHT